MKQLLKRSAGAAIRAADRTGLIDCLERLPERSGLLRVLTYHRIVARDDPGVCPGLWSATPAGFERQMCEVAARYDVVSLADVVAAGRGERDLPPRALLITFDDGYRDFDTNAWPVLDRMGLPATLFVATALPDAPEQAFWWDRLFAALTRTERREPLATPAGLLSLATAQDRLAAFGRLKATVKRSSAAAARALVDDLSRELGAPHPQAHVLGWDALRRLSTRGVSVCPHTRTHPQLDRVTEAEARAEVRGAIEDLRREIHDVPPVFCFPDGRFTTATLRILGEEGIELAFTTARGVNAFPSREPLLLRRIPVGPRSTQALLRAQLLAFSMASAWRGASR